jgi:hypothetical protein
MKSINSTPIIEHDILNSVAHMLVLQEMGSDISFSPSRIHGINEHQFTDQAMKRHICEPLSHINVFLPRFRVPLNVSKYDVISVLKRGTRKIVDPNLHDLVHEECT